MYDCTYCLFFWVKALNKANIEKQTWFLSTKLLTLTQLLTLIDTLNYGKEKENECFAQGLVGKTRKWKDWAMKMQWMAFRGENARWWEMESEICNGAGTDLYEGF